jgi:protoporphyrinogen oxidase
MNLIVIGAGITGLAAAHYACRHGHTVTVFESSPHAGGLCGSFTVGDTTLEMYYHHVFCGHQALIELAGELGLRSDLVFKKARMGFYCERRIYPFVNAWDLIRFRSLKMRDRLHLGLGALAMMRIKDWRSIENRSALDWLRQYCGEAACRIVWTPLLKMKFGDNFDRISAAWIWNRVVDRRRAKKNSGDAEMLGYIGGGYKRLFDALTKEITERGGKIHTGVPVQSICTEGQKLAGVVADGSFFAADVVLAAVPVPVFVQLAPGLSQDYVQSLSSIAYQGSTCVVLQLKHSLSPYYWINVSDPLSPFVGIIEHTNLIAPEFYGGRHLVYLTRYSSSNDPIFSKPGEDIYREFSSYLKSVFPLFRDESVAQYWVFQDRFSQPVFVTGYSKMIPAHATPVKNLYLVNSSQLYPESRCLNSSIAAARRVVDESITT